MSHKLLSVLIALSLALALGVGCGDPEEENKNNDNTHQNHDNNENNEDPQCTVETVATDCDADYTCEDGVCTAPAATPECTVETVATDCDADYTCEDGVCTAPAATPECTVATVADDCAAGQTCEEGVCTDPAVEEPGNIAEVATAAGSFTTLLAAVDAAGLTDALTDETATLTVFAPTDAAFALLGDLVDTLLLEENKAILTDILTFHVVAAEAPSSALGDEPELDTLNGAKAKITKVGEDFFFAGAKINLTMVDIEASNGTIHVLDAVAVPTLDIVGTAVVNGFDTLVAAVRAADLEGALTADGDMTVFAPTNAAFAELGDLVATLVLPENAAILGDILTYHVIGSAAGSAALPGVTELETLNGAMAPITKVGDDFFFAGQKIDLTMVDIEATNGTIHVIEGVAVPQLNVIGEALLGGFNTLVAAVRAAGLEATLTDAAGTFTIFAPTDAAFAEVPAATLAALLADPAALAPILTYHVLGSIVLAADVAAGDVTTVNGADATITTEGGVKYAGATVTATDLEATNGVIHTIDAVVMPPNPI